MLKLSYDLFTKRGWVRRESEFTTGEKRTAAAFARDYRDNPEKYRNVVLVDFSLVKGEVVTILPADPDAGRLAPVEVSRVTAKVPACSLVDLKRLPRASQAKPASASKTAKRKAGIGVRADAFDLPKPRHQTKRARQYGAESPKLAALAEQSSPTPVHPRGQPPCRNPNACGCSA
jgi:hypothetical protein